MCASNQIRNLRGYHKRIKQRHVVPQVKKTTQRDYSACLLRVHTTPHIGQDYETSVCFHGTERWQALHDWGVVWKFGRTLLMRKAYFQPGQLFADVAF